MKTIGVTQIAFGLQDLETGKIFFEALKLSIYADVKLSVSRRLVGLEATNFGN